MFVLFVLFVFFFLEIIELMFPSTQGFTLLICSAQTIINRLSVMIKPESYSLQLGKEAN